MSDDNFCVPPHSIEAEQALIGCFLLGAASTNEKVAEALIISDFYRDDHRVIVEAICGLLEEKVNVDVITVAEKLDVENKLSYVGGLAYLGALASNVPSLKSAVDYADIVCKKSMQRQLIKLGNDLVDYGNNPDSFRSGDFLAGVVEMVDGFLPGYMEITRCAGNADRTE